jgi:hypothetical protein
VSTLRRHASQAAASAIATTAASGIATTAAPGIATTAAAESAAGCAPSAGTTSAGRAARVIRSAGSAGVVGPARVAKMMFRYDGSRQWQNRTNVTAVPVRIRTPCRVPRIAWAPLGNGPGWAWDSSAATKPTHAKPATITAVAAAESARSLIPPYYLG